MDIKTYQDAFPNIFVSLDIYIVKIFRPALLRMCANSSHLSIIFDHNVAVVPVSYPKDKCSYTVASTRPCEQIYSHVVPAKAHKHTINLDF